MADIFAGARGCVYHSSSKGAAGWYSLSGLSNKPEILVMGAEVTDSDVVLPETCVDQKKVLYLFGQKFGDVRVAGTILCGPAGQTVKDFDTVLNWFQTNRVTAAKKPVNLSTPGGKAYKVYVLGLSLAMPDAEFHTQPFMVYGMIAEPPK